MKKYWAEKNFRKFIPFILLYAFFIFAYLTYVNEVAEAIGVSITIAYILMIPITFLVILIVSLIMIRWDNFTRSWRIVVCGFAIVGPFLIISILNLSKILLLIK